MKAKEIKEMKISIEEATLFLFVDEIISYIRNSKKLYQKYSKNFSNMVNTKIYL